MVPRGGHSRPSVLIAPAHPVLRDLCASMYKFATPVHPCTMVAPGHPWPSRHRCIPAQWNRTTDYMCARELPCHLRRQETNRLDCESSPECESVTDQGLDRQMRRSESALMAATHAGADRRIRVRVHLSLLVRSRRRSRLRPPPGRHDPYRRP
jgi:hypothetical protein